MYCYPIYTHHPIPMQILRQTPFDACQLILGGTKTSFDDRYNR